MEYLLAIGLAMLAGLLLTRLTKRFNLPDVTSYLIAGLLVGPLALGAAHIPGLGFDSFEFVEEMGLICDVALGFIAFSIGNEFRLEDLKHIGRQATVIAIFQAITATVFVDAGLFLLHLVVGSEVLPISTCLILGAIATATAPAATIMVINQYKAKGPLTSILLPIVALDDAVGLVVFAVSTGVAKALNSGSISLVSVLVNPLVEIVCSLGLGAGMGWLFSYMERFFHSRSKRLSLTVCFVFLCTALSKLEFSLGEVEIGFSPLLVCMMCGTIFCNLCDFSEEIMYRTDRWTAPVFVLFFVLSGAELDLRVFQNLAVVGVGLVYILARSAGKIIGAHYSAKAVHCEHNICKYLGITLLPQAGVALGMSVTVAAQFGAEGAVIRNITLFSVLIYELVGPIMTKIALTAAGEIEPTAVSSRGVIPTTNQQKG